MVDTVDDSTLTGEPFKAGDDWFRCVVEKPGEVRMTWGPTADWADWDPLDFVVIPEDATALTVVALSSTFKGETVCPSS
jgi:hypothetical protein